MQLYLDLLDSKQSIFGIVKAYQDTHPKNIE